MSAVPDLAAGFRAAVPGLDVDDDPVRRALRSADIAGPATVAGALLRPADADQVVALVRHARREGIALFPRGGGWSYTAGYAPRPGPAALVDTALLQGIAIDAEAGTVTAGAGVTWGGLHAVLEERGLRAASFGPLSGFGATVGGGAAQNGGFFGAAGHGALGDGGILGGTMVDGTGTVVTLLDTDRAEGIAAPQPLVGDCGAFGLRLDVTLRTIPRPPVTRFASFGFENGEAALFVLAGLPGLPGLGDAYVFDPGTHANMARSGFSVLESAAIANDLIQAGGGLLGRLSGLLRTARAGKAFVADLAWSLHLALDGSAAEAAVTLAEVTSRVARAGGEAIPDVIPRVTRARPFRRIKALLGPDGEAWLPLHGVFAAGDAVRVLAAVSAALAREARVMELHGIRAVVLAVLMGRRVVIEPQLFWPDGLSDVHRAMAQPDQVANYGTRPMNPVARAEAHALRKRLVTVLDQEGAAHLQIGRSYAGHPGVSVAARDQWAALKRRMDPDGIMNPGVLGL